jgi:Lon protease-like protein
MANKVFLFPLNNSILFKKVTLPYHIFEPRYKQMINDSIENKIPIGIVKYRNFEKYNGVYCVAGIPEILSSYPDGRLDIYIMGSVKCLITDAINENPYKIYEFKLVEENLHLDSSFEMDLESLRTFLNRWSLSFIPDPVQREAFMKMLSDREALINYSAVFLVEDPLVKEKIMEADSLEKKLKILLSYLGPKEISLGPFMPNLKF